MPKKDNELFLRVALATRAIDLKQFNEVSDELGANPSEDSGQILLDKGFITEEQRREISQAMEEANGKEIVGNSGEGNDVIDPDEGIPYTEDFELLRLIGQGGAGRVFLAFDEMIGREVALKEVLPAKLDKSKDYHLRRFIREAKISGRLQHPGIVPIYELKEKDDGTYFYVMKYVQGQTLFHAIMHDSEAETPYEAFGKRIKLLDRLIDVCQAMGYSHSKHIIHRDLKPSNVILGEFGETIILDWGLAKFLGEKDEEAQTSTSHDDDEGEEGLTKVGAQLGTPSYMAPEQIDGALGEVNASTDVYTLGIILFMILTGSKPYPGRGEEVMKLIMDSDRSPSPRDLYDFIPPELSAICDKALAKDQKDRFQNASELAEQLKAYRDGRLVTVYAYSRGELFKRFVARNKIAIVAATIVLLSVIGGAGFATKFGIEAHRARLKAINALEEVTKLSESAMVMVRSKAQTINAYFDTFDTNLDATSKRIAKIGLNESTALERELQAILEDHPEAEAFLVIADPERIVASYPKGAFVPKRTIGSEMLYLRGKRGAALEGDSALFDSPQGGKSFVMSAPIRKGSKLIGGLTTLMNAEKAVPIFLDFDPKESPYQVWVMKENGLIVYDEDPKQVGLNLFTDDMYRDFPELLRFGELIKKQPWGIGNYNYLGKDGKTKVYKVAAWDTLNSDGTEWKLVVTQQYTSE